MLLSDEVYLYLALQKYMQYGITAQLEDSTMSSPGSHESACDYPLGSKEALNHEEGGSANGRKPGEAGLPPLK